MELYLNGGGRRVGERCVEVTGRGGLDIDARRELIKESVMDG